MTLRRYVLAVPFASFTLLVAGGSAHAAGLPTAPNVPPVNAGMSVGSGPVAVVAVNLPAGSSDATSSGGTTSQAGAASGSGSASPATTSAADSCVSCTNASSSGGSSSANANETSLLGRGFSGGGSSGNGSGSGSVVAVAAGPAATANIASWMASSNSSPSTGSSTAQADLATVQLGNQLATVAIVGSNSQASSSRGANGSSSGQGSSSADGVSASGMQGQVAVILLHSNSPSNGQAHAYLASLNGQEFGSSSNGPMPITIPGAGTIVLVPTSGSGGQSSAGDANGDASPQNTQRFQFGVQGTRAAGAAAPGDQAAAAPAGQVTGIGAAVPLTGAAISLIALLLIGGGVACTATGGAAGVLARRCPRRLRRHPQG